MICFNCSTRVQRESAGSLKVTGVKNVPVIKVSVINHR